MSDNLDTPAALRPYIVGVGASAGGLEALERFFAHVPRDSGMAFVVVQHLSPDFKSLMDELLARHTSLPIELVQDNVLVEPDHIYLIPPGKGMIISSGRLLLRDRERTHELTLPIDEFFRSLARDVGERAIAVVLSGSGSDGSRGIRDVHAAGGLVVVQTPQSAQFDGMPRAAEEAGVASLVLPPENIAEALVAHIGSGSRDRHRIVAEPRPDGLDTVFQMLQSEFGIDFTHYKPSTVTRRIERRLQLSRTSDVGGYVERLRNGRDELDRLYRDLLIGVTRFFRNEEAFAVLERSVLPEMIASGPRDVPFRVWVAGCATGEEAYSLAILLAELSAKHGGRQAKIFATDVHPGSIEVAARATYSEEALANVSPERVQRWFHKRGAGYQLVHDIRQMVVFAPHNVVRDAPFTRMDLISCRNMLIYLQTPAQQRVLGLFHFALNRGGVMFLGPSETPGALLSDFATIDRQWRIYRKLGDARLAPQPSRSPARGIERVAPGLSAAPPRHSLTSLLGTYDALLDEVMPPSLLIDERGELVHAFAGASRFLKLRDGRQVLDVLEVLEGELRMVVVGGLQRAKREPSTLVFRGGRAGADLELHDVSIRRVHARNATSAPHVLVTIAPSAAPSRRPPEQATEVDLDQLAPERLATLERELSYTKQNLQAAVEELETGNEELQAANEELLASNEELQSTNEELQSVNEELYTVNAEYQRKIAELTELTNDMDNLLASTDVGTLFLDRELRIRKFTPQVAESFSLLPQDVGRSIEGFTHRLHYPELLTEIRRVAASGAPIEREIRAGTDRVFFVRLLPYRAGPALEGVVVTFIDVTSMRAAEDALFHERHLLNSLLETLPDAVYFRDADGKFIRANAAMSARLGLSDPHELEGKSPAEVVGSETAAAMDRDDEVVLRTGKIQSYRLEERKAADGTRWELVTRLPIAGRESRTVGVIGVLRDVTAQKLADDRIREAVRRRDEFLAMLSHELRNPLGAIVTATAMLKSDAPPPRRGKLVEVLERQSGQMARLLDDLLEAGRVMQNKIELRKRTIDLCAVVKDAVDAVRSTMDARGHELEVDLTSPTLHVDGDPTRLHQICANILNNAAKYTPPGGHIYVGVRKDDDRAVITVRDDGTGIAPDMLERVFDLFVQSPRTLERSEGGLGLGLTLVKTLVEMHGGTVVARSEGIGRGTEVEVRLTVVEAPAGADRTAVVRPAPRLPLGRRIVVVEDNHDCREVLCELLTQAGFECRWASHGDEGLALIREMVPDIALVDVGLPGIDGYEVARRARAESWLDSVFLVAVTGYGQAVDRERALEVGFDAHLVKPVDADDLLHLLAGAKVGAEERSPR
jgi:two-component system CheB/CheR fusion protein